MCMDVGIVDGGTLAIMDLHKQLYREVRRHLEDWVRGHRITFDIWEHGASQRGNSVVSMRCFRNDQGKP